LVKRCEASQRFGIVCGEVHEHADAPYALALLRALRAATQPQHQGA